MFGFKLILVDLQRRDNIQQFVLVERAQIAIKSIAISKERPSPLGVRKTLKPFTCDALQIETKYVLVGVLPMCRMRDDLPSSPREGFLAQQKSMGRFSNSELEITLEK
jgi:hypothetical protein